MQNESRAIPFRSTVNSIDHELTRVDDSESRFSVCRHPRLAQVAISNPLGFRHFKGLSRALRNAISMAESVGWSVIEEAGTVTFYDSSETEGARLIDFTENRAGFLWEALPLTEVSGFLATGPLRKIVSNE